MAGKKDIVEQALKLIAGSSDDAAKRIASIRKSEPFPVDYIEPGSVRYRYEHPDTSAFMEIITRPKGARSASVIGLEVPEEYRGTGIGKALQERVLQDYPSLMGQVSSKAAAVNAYRAGRRPLANPNATLEDVFKMIDEDSSVNLATEKNIGGSIRQGYGPGGWVDDIVKMAGKVISGEGDDAAKAGIKAYRGTPQPTENLIDLFHGTTPEAFDAITSSGDIFGSSRFSPRRDVAETFAHNVGGDANTVVKVKAPASSLMIDLDLPAAKLLTPDEAAAYLDKPDWTILDFIENGYSVGVPDTSVLSIDRAAGGRIAKGPGGWLDDVVKMAGKVISGEGEDAAKAGIRAYHGTPHDFDRFEWSPKTRGTGEGAQAYGDGLYFAEREGVAKGYRDALSPKNYLLNAPEPEIAQKYGQDVLDMFSSHGGDPNELKDTINRLSDQNKRDLYDLGASDVSQVKPQNDWGIEANLVNRADRVNRLQGLLASPDVKINPGHMYEVNINANPDSFLDWDKPLSEQPEAVRKLFPSVEEAKLLDAQMEKLSVDVLANPNDKDLQATWDAAYRSPKHRMASIVLNEANPKLGGKFASGDKAYSAIAEKPSEASALLRKAGIPGIKFFDAGSRAAGEGTRNYVVFDDKIISIIRKYGIAGASAMLGYNLMEQLDPKQALAASMADQDYQSGRPQRSMGGNNSISGALNVARRLNGGE